MNKILGNYTGQPHPNFPLDCETLQYIQDNAAIAELIGNIAGDKVILSGCAVNGNNAAEGYIFLRTQEFPDGEVLRFEGGNIVTGIYLEKTSVSVSANADNYPNAYTQRVLKAGIGGSGSQQFQWSDFAPLSGKTNRELADAVARLQAQIASLQPAPVGAVLIWPSDNIPAAYHLCDGSSLSSDDYPELYAVLGHTYGGSGNQFYLPDMRGRYIAGRGANGYDTLHQPTNSDGANTVVLTESQMPEHNHGGVTGLGGAHQHYSDFNTYRNAGEAEAADYTRNRFARGNGEHEYQRITTNNAEDHTHSIPTAGGGQAHENRPPFIIMNYIIKIQ